MSARQLVIEPRVRLLPRHRRSLLRRVEQAHRPTLAHHVHRPPGLGQCMMISAGWYNTKPDPLRQKGITWEQTPLIQARGNCRSQTRRGLAIVRTGVQTGIKKALTSSFHRSRATPGRGGGHDAVKTASAA